MGIINVTPDSFADGGQRFDPTRAIADGLRMSPTVRTSSTSAASRRGRAPSRSTADEELRRVLPVIEALARDGRVPISIDTYKAEVARAALRSRARRSSTTSAGCSTTAILRRSSRARGAAVVLMHNRGRSREMYARPCTTTSPARSAGSSGRGRRATRGGHRARGAHPRSRPRLRQARRAHLGGAGGARTARRARSSDAGRAVTQVVPDVGDRRRPPAERDWATAAAVPPASCRRAHRRVHGVREMVDVVRVADRLRAATRAAGSTAQRKRITPDGHG